MFWRRLIEDIFQLPWVWYVDLSIQASISCQRIRLNRGSVGLDDLTEEL